MLRASLLPLLRRAGLPVLLLCACSTGGPAPEGFTPADGGKLNILCRTSDREPLPGTALTLCPREALCTLGSRAGRSAICDGKGQAVFRDIPSGSYFLRGELSGFATTVVGPLEIGAGSPIAPETVVVVLNPVCYDC